jgi:hypothetical protein
MTLVCPRLMCPCGVDVLHFTHGAETKDSIISFSVYPFQILSPEGFTPSSCARFVLNSTSLQLIPAYSSQGALFL